MRKYQVIVIGGGASGMLAVIEAAKRGAKTAIIEHKDRLGKKILATGNGKCNFTNLYQTKDCYRGSHPEFAWNLIQQFDAKQTMEYFQRIGILPKERNGYVYPNSEQAASIADVLIMECRRYHVDIFLSEHVSEITKKQNQFLITTDGTQYEAKSIVLATGGCAAPKQGSDGSGYALAKAFGHRIISPFPALVQLKAKEKYGKVITGVRCEAKGTMTNQGKFVVSEKGEFLFTDYGISGIPVLQMSRYATELVEQGKNPILTIDFFPELTQSELIAMLKDRFAQDSLKTVEEAMVGMLNHKLNYLLLKEAKIRTDGSCKSLKEHEVLALVKLMKELTFTITGSNGFDQAQVSAGGVDVSKVNPKTLESELVEGLYFTGEILDVDGTCGGYNLQWAWTSGVIVGKNIRF